jgi:hypothetical protein
MVIKRIMINVPTGRKAEEGMKKAYNPDNKEGFIIRDDGRELAIEQGYWIPGLLYKNGVITGSVEEIVEFSRMVQRKN